MGWRGRPLARVVPYALALAAFTVLAPALARAAEQAKPSAESFETLAQGAVETRDVATLLAPFVDACGGEMRELDRARCRAVTAYLKRRLPQQRFIAESTDPAAIEVSGYDASAKGYHLVLAGCLACTEPMKIGGRDPRFVTLATPDKRAANLVAGVPVSKSVVAFDDFAAAKKWADTERPYLKAEFLFQPQPEGSDFTVGMAPGIALKLIGARVYNRCTGEILVSKPPSTGYAERPPLGHEDAACASAGQPLGPSPEEAAAAAARPDELSKTAINDVMAKLRPRLYACYEKFHVPGALVLSYVVGGNGTVQSVQIGSTFAGTPTGACAADIAKETRFPTFKRERQEFKYLFFLRRS